MSSVGEFGNQVADVVDGLPHVPANEAAFAIRYAQEILTAAGAESEPLEACIAALGNAAAALQTARQHIVQGDTQLTSYLQTIGLAHISRTHAEMTDALGARDIISDNPFRETVNKNEVLAAFKKVLDRKPGPLTYDEYAALCIEANAIASRLAGGDARVTLELFRYFGTEVLARVFPDVQQYQVAVDFTAGDMAVTKGDGQFTGLPSHVRGIPIEQIIGITGGGVLYHAGQDGDHIQTAYGNCTTTSLHSTKRLLENHPELSGHVGPIEFETPSRRTVASENTPRRMKPIGANHTLFGIFYRNSDGTKMVLCIDPTVGQVDWTPDYDIEITAIPEADLANYMRLRYGTYPDIPVRYSRNLTQQSGT